MRPRLITVPKVLLFLVACAVFGGLAYWIKGGMPLPGSGVPSTAGKIAFISDRNGSHNDLWITSADGSGTPVALTDDAADDSQPAWSESGSEITFISSDRKGVNPQVFVVDAKPGATVLPVTNTSSSKDAPFFGAEGLIYYLDAGKLNSGNSSATDFDALLPGPDLRLALSNLFSTGGLVRAAVSPDGKRYLGVLKGEEAEALLLFEPEGEVLAVLGYGKRVYPEFRPDGGWAAVFVDGGPLPEPGLLYSDAAVQAAADKQESFVPPKPLPFRPQEGSNTLVTWDKSGTMGPPNPLPAAPNALRISPDGKKLALCFDLPAENGKPAQSGVVVLQDGGVSAPVQISKLPATEPTWSPDGSQIAFVSGPDIYTVAADGSGAPVNLTQGKGTNHSPAWSPAKIAAAPKK